MPSAFLSSISKSGDVAERSPAVISANLKEDMLLHKKLVVLNRSERSIVHQIKVDQKVLYKRFQAKLTRSKLGNARILGQRDLQQDLRSKNLATLNTDIVGAADEDYVFLKMLEQRPCTASSYSPCISEPRRSVTPKSALGRKEKQHDNNKTHGRAASATARLVNANGTAVTSTKDKHSELRQTAEEAVARANTGNAVGDDANSVTSVGEKKVKLRPATSKGTRVEQEFLKHQHDMRQVAKDKGDETSDYTSIGAVSEVTDHGEDSANGEQHDDTESETVVSSKSEDKVDDVRDSNDPDIVNNTVAGDSGGQHDGAGEKKQTVAFMEAFKLNGDNDEKLITNNQSNGDADGSPRSPRSPSRRAKGGADFFQDEKKIDVISLRLKHSKSLDYTSHVQRFCSEVEEMNESQEGPSVDYYSMRLLVARERADDPARMRVPGTPEDENKRSVGNIFVRSLTVPEINWNFDN